MLSKPCTHATIRYQSQFPRKLSSLGVKSSASQRSGEYRRRTQVSSYMSSSGLAAVGAVALAGLFTWGVKKMGGGEQGIPRASGKSEMVYEDNVFNREVLERCGTMMSEYHRFWGVLNGHMETIWGSWFRRDPGAKYERESLKRPDGGTVTLDYFDPENKPALPENAPIVVLLPGLTGGSGCRYVQYSAQRAYQFGFRSIVFNSRGTADSQVTSAQFYSASFTEDARGVFKHIASKFPEARVIAIGWSLGGNILVNYLGEEGDSTPLSAAVSLCNPFNLVECDLALQKGFSTVYGRNLANGLAEMFAPHAHLFKDKPGFDIELALSCKTVREFDKAVTHVAFGWKDVDDYYQNSGSHLAIPNVRIPLLCIQAADDPIAVSRSIPREAIRNNPNCVLVVTPSGGHLGWIAGEGAPFSAPWTDLASMEWIKSVLEHLGDGENKASLGVISEKNLVGKAL